MKSYDTHGEVNLSRVVNDMCSDADMDLFAHTSRIFPPEACRGGTSQGSWMDHT